MAGGIALGIIVDQEHLSTRKRSERSHIHGGCGFANATLLI